MKTKMYSISMKAALTLVAVLVFSAFVNAQFVTPSPDSPVTQAPSEEIRFGSTGVTYSLNNVNHNAGDQYRWVVTGGTITAAGGAPITGGNTVEFFADAHTITVDWDQAPGSAITSLAGSIQVQKINTLLCPSQVLTLAVDVWNPATATITTVTEAICSGDGPAVTDVTVALTGAPDDLGGGAGFSVDWSFTVPVGLSALDGGGAAVTTSGTLTTDGASVDIPMPVTLLNSTGGALDFVVQITAMNDDFGGAGTFSGTYTVTVNPVPVTGDIVSSLSLTR